MRYSKKQLISGCKLAAKTVGLLGFLGLVSYAGATYNISFGNGKRRFDIGQEPSFAPDPYDSITNDRTFQEYSECVKDAMQAVYDGSKGMIFDDDLVLVATKIYNLSQRTRSISANQHAIKLLSDIRKRITFTDAKLKVTSMISQIF